MFRIHSLIVTLGTGTFLHGLTLYVSDSMTISGISDWLMDLVIVDRLLGIPLEFYYALLLCILVWYVFEYTAIGRQMLFVGRGREVARLSGINTDRVRRGCLVVSSFMGALAGVLVRGHAGRGRPGLRRIVSAAGFRRGLSRVHQHHARTFQCVGIGDRGLLPGGGHHRAGVHGRQQLRAGHVLWRRIGPGGHPVAIGPRPRRAAILARLGRRFAMYPANGVRDLVGYGRTPPDPQWPNGARLALNFVLNIEEGSEYSIENGDGVL